MTKLHILRCPHCGRNRVWEQRGKDISKSYAMCFYDNKRFKIHTHIDKQSTILEVKK